MVIIILDLSRHIMHGMAGHAGGHVWVLASNWSAYLPFYGTWPTDSVRLNPVFTLDVTRGWDKANGANRYISDVGAFKLRPLFIAGCSVTSGSLILAFIAERWLRHTGRLARNTAASQKILSVLSTIAAAAGFAGLILLSIFDTFHHPRMHDGFLGLFILGHAVSAIFLCAEYQRLGIHYRQHRVLRISFWMKLFFIIVEVSLAIVFGVTQKYHKSNIAAIVEWVISLIFAFYILSFVVDLLPSVRTKTHTPQGWKETVAQHETGMSQPNDYGVPLTHDSAGPNQGDYRGHPAADPNVTNGHAYVPPSRNF